MGQYECDCRGRNPSCYRCGGSGLCDSRGRALGEFSSAAEKMKSIATMVHPTREGLAPLTTGQELRDFVVETKRRVNAMRCRIDRRDYDAGQTFRDPGKQASWVAVFCRLKHLDGADPSVNFRVTSKGEKSVSVNGPRAVELLLKDQELFLRDLK